MVDCVFFGQAMRLYLIWDSEGIQESEDRVLEQIFESVDEESESGSDDDGLKGKKNPKKSKGSKNKKRARDESVTSDGSSDESSSSKAHVLLDVFDDLA